MVKEEKLHLEDLEDEGFESVKNKFMTYFLLFFPTIIIIAIPDVINGGIMLSMSIKILLAFYQFVTLKTFVDKHYD